MIHFSSSDISAKYSPNCVCFHLACCNSVSVQEEWGKGRVRQRRAGVRMRVPFSDVYQLLSLKRCYCPPDGAILQRGIECLRLFHGLSWVGLMSKGNRHTLCFLVLLVRALPHPAHGLIYTPSCSCMTSRCLPRVLRAPVSSGKLQGRRWEACGRCSDISFG